MGIMLVSSLSSYMKTMEMQAKWQQKQEKGDYAPEHTESADKEFKKQIDDMRYPEYDRSARMESDIETKLTSGKELSDEEMQYLKNHDPGTYQKARIIQRERKSYEKSLAACTTKEEVEQLKADHAAAAVERVKAIRYNPYLSRKDMRELIRMEHFKAAALDDAMHEFMKDADYKRLPDGGDVSKKEDLGNEAEETKEITLVETEIQHPSSLQLSLEMDPNMDLAELKELSKAAEKAEKQEISLSKIELDDGKKTPAPDESTDDAAEEGSILKAILDEEARWAREDEEKAASSPQEAPGPADQADSLNMAQNKAKAAYYSAQSYEPGRETSRIDVRK